MPIPVLMYHAIGDRSSRTQKYNDQDFTVSEPNFRQQLQFLKDQGFSTTLFSDIRADDCFAQRKLVITFDDGHKTDISRALPILQEFGFVAEFFITTAWIDTLGYLSEEDLQLLSAAGMGIGSHGHSHEFFASMTDSEAERELELSLSRLQAVLGFPVTGFSLPGGQAPKDLDSLIDRFSLSYVCTSVEALCDSRNFPHAIPRVAIRRDTGASDFAAIVNGEQQIFRRMQRRTAVISMLRRLLGNDLYMSLRERVLQYR